MYTDSLMPTELATDPLKARIAIMYSPACEMVASLHVLAAPDHHAPNLPWVFRVTAEMPSDLLAETAYFGRHFNQWLNVFDVLQAVDGPGHAGGYRPLGHPVEEVLTRVGAMDSGEFLRLFLGNGKMMTPSEVELARSDPEGMRRRLVGVLGRYWAEVFRPELAVREPALLERIREEGLRLERMDVLEFLASLHERISADRDAGELVFHKWKDYHVPLAGLERIILIPSTFIVPHLMINPDPRELTIYINVLPPVAGGRARAGEVPPDLLAGFKALADDSRLRILRELHAGERCTQDLAAGLKFSEATISRHLKLLRDAGLVESRREGSFVYYAAVQGSLEALVERLQRYLRPVRA